MKWFRDDQIKIEVRNDIKIGNIFSQVKDGIEVEEMWFTKYRVTNAICRTLYKLHNKFSNGWQPIRHKVALYHNIVAKKTT